MTEGTVKWFNNKKGYGFIQPLGGGNDIFVHYSSIEMEGYRSLTDGDKVDFELSNGPKGMQARKVQRIV